jgi:predicted metal-dependent hydrolase
VSSELKFEAGGSGAVKLVRSPTARRLRLRVDRRTGAVLLTVPRFHSERKALAWAAGHRDWIERQLAAVAPPERLAPGTILPLHGLARRILVGGPEENLEARLLRWLKRHAAEILTAETHEFAARAGVACSRVAVGDPLSRWGSCSSSGAIRYSWRLILAPDWVRRATVAHEAAHLVHMNHGPDFHILVEHLLGADPKPARSWLRSSGPLLHRFGRS